MRCSYCGRPLTTMQCSYCGRAPARPEHERLQVERRRSLAATETDPSWDNTVRAYEDTLESLEDLP